MQKQATLTTTRTLTERVRDLESQMKVNTESIETVKTEMQKIREEFSDLRGYTESTLNDMNENIMKQVNMIKQQYTTHTINKVLFGTILVLCVFLLIIS